MSLFSRCPVPSRAGCWLRCQLRKYRDSALPARLPGSYAADTTTRSGMTLSGTSPDMRLGSPRRLVAMSKSTPDGHSRSTLVQLPSHTSSYHSAPSFSDPITSVSPRPAAPRPKTSSFSVSVSLLHAWNSSCAALAGTWTVGPSRRKFLWYAYSGGFCLGSGLPSEARVKGEGLLLYFDAVRIGSRGFARILHC